MAGAVKQPYSVFVTSSGIGITVWNIILIGLGYTLRENWKAVGTYYEEYKTIVIPLLILGVVVLLFKITPLKRLLPKKEESND